MNNKELKPCPFCGGQADLNGITGDYAVICDECGSASLNYNTELEAIEAWNTRNYNKECCEKSCKEENATSKPLVPKWVDIGGGRYYSEVSIMQAVKMVFEIKYDTYDEPFLYTLKAFFKVWDSECDYEEEYGVFNTLKEAKQKANECIRELGERLVYFANNIRTTEHLES